MSLYFKLLFLPTLFLGASISSYSQDYIVFRGDSVATPQVLITFKKSWVTFQPNLVSEKQTIALTDITEIYLKNDMFFILPFENEMVAMRRLSRYKNIELLEYGKYLFLRADQQSLTELTKGNYKQRLSELADSAINLKNLKYSKNGIKAVIDQLDQKRIEIINNEFLAGLIVRNSTLTVTSDAFPTNPADFDVENSALGIHIGLQKKFEKAPILKHQINAAAVQNSFSRNSSSLLSKEELVFKHINISLDYSLHVNPKIKNIEILMGVGGRSNLISLEDNVFNYVSFNDIDPDQGIAYKQDRSYLLDIPLFMFGYFWEVGIKIPLFRYNFIQLAYLGESNYTEGYKLTSKSIQLSIGF